jgi:hypothetical protein
MVTLVVAKQPHIDALTVRAAAALDNTHVIGGREPRTYNARSRDRTINRLLSPKVRQVLTILPGAIPGIQERKLQ